VLDDRKCNLNVKIEEHATLNIQYQPIWYLL